MSYKRRAGHTVAVWNDLAVARFFEMGDRDATLRADIPSPAHGAEGAMPPIVAFRAPTFGKD